MDEIKKAELEILALTGYWCIGYSLSGSLLIVKMIGENIGMCRWLSKRFKPNGALPFDMCASPFQGDPGQVIAEMLLSPDYFQYDNFDHAGLRDIAIRSGKLKGFLSGE